MEDRRRSVTRQGWSVWARSASYPCLVPRSGTAGGALCPNLRSRIPASDSSLKVSSSWSLWELWKARAALSKPL
jgi:hypothetical protein